MPCGIGLVTFDWPPASLQELVAAGDELMYKAKPSGKAASDRRSAPAHVRAGRLVSGGKATLRHEGLVATLSE